MADKKPYYITTAIAYTSGKPHIGNTYEIILADAIARYKRSQGYDVFFQTGTDEHGQKIELKAEEAGVTPKEFVDNVSGEIKKIWDLMDTSYDKFIRTTDEDHEKQVQKIFKKLYDQGDIYKGHYEGMYCTPSVCFQNIIQMGNPGRLRSETCNLRMAGCAYKLYHRNRIRLRWKQHGAVSQIMAGRSASDRKRYHSLPYNLLANLFDGTGSSASKTGIRTSMAASGRRKNE